MEQQIPLKHFVYNGLTAWMKWIAAPTTTTTITFNGEST